MREGREGRESRWAPLKVFTGLVVVAFAVTLAVVVGNRLSEEALGVLAGTVCGVGAAIPTSLIVVAVTRRQNEDRSRRSRDREREYESRQAYPPVVVISPGNDQRSGWGSGRGEQYGNRTTTPHRFSEREFRVVGGDLTGTEESRRRESGRF